MPPFWECLLCWFQSFCCSRSEKRYIPHTMPHQCPSTKGILLQSLSASQMFPQYSDQEYVQPNNKATGFIAIHEVLSARFLDTVSYTPDPSVIIGGAWGCMRFWTCANNAPKVDMYSWWNIQLWNAVRYQHLPWWYCQHLEISLNKKGKPKQLWQGQSKSEFDTKTN